MKLWPLSVVEKCTDNLQVAERFDFRRDFDKGDSLWILDEH